MKLTFLGTRGEIQARTREHRMHSSALVTDRRCRIMIDCGRDWLKRVTKMRLSAIFLTHAHSDHADGLKNGAPCEVFATAETWEKLRNFGIRSRSVVPPHEPIKIGELTFQAFPVEHSLRAPAVGYRLASNNSSVFYVPDVASIPELEQVLSGVSVYIGDGATVRRSLIRQRAGALIGHAPITVQLQWCKQENVPRAFFTHCGSQIVNAGPKATAEEIRTLGHRLSIDAQIAHDGLEIAL